MRIYGWGSYRKATDSQRAIFMGVTKVWFLAKYLPAIDHQRGWQPVSQKSQKYLPPASWS